MMDAGRCIACDKSDTETVVCFRGSIEFIIGMIEALKGDDKGGDDPLVAGETARFVEERDGLEPGEWVDRAYPLCRDCAVKAELEVNDPSALKAGHTGVRYLEGEEEAQAYIEGDAPTGRY
jgi:hypothetical protein